MILQTLQTDAGRAICSRTHLRLQNIPGLPLHGKNSVAHLRQILAILACCICVLINVIASSAQTLPLALLTAPKLTFVDSNGTPVAGGFLYTYYASTSTPLATYRMDTLGNISPNPNPVNLDSTGSAEVRIQALNYKMRLEDANHVQIWEIDQISDPGQLLYAHAVVIDPVGSALQTILGPLAANWFVGLIPHTTSPGVRVALIDPASVLDTTVNPPNLVTATPGLQGQTYGVPDPQSFNATFVLSPGPPDWSTLTPYALQTVILPRTNNPCDFTFLVTTAGTTAVLNPTFSTLPCSLSPATVIDGTVVWTNQGVFSNNNTLDCTQTGLKCKRTAYVYFEGAGCNNAASGLGWDTFGTNAPVPICITGANIQKGVMALPGAATRVQENFNTSTAGTNVVAYPAATVTGDLLVVECAVDTSRTISGVTDGTNAYTKAKGQVNGVLDLEIWYFNGNSTSMPAATNLTVTFTGAGNSACNWKEYSGILTASALDQTASNTGTGTAVTSGTAAGTAQAVELVLAAVGSVSNPAVAGQSGWTQHNVISQSTNVTVNSQGLIQQASAVQSATFSLGTSQIWASAIATFKVNVGSSITAQRGWVLPSYFLASSPINTAIKWMSPQTPIGTVNANLAASIVCTADGSTDDPTFNASTTAVVPISTVTVNTVTNTPFLSLATTPVACAAGNILHLRIQRQRYDPTDTFEGYVYVLGVPLIFGSSN